MFPPYMKPLERLHGSPACVRVDFRLRVPTEAYLARCRAIVDEFRAVDGLIWKMWFADEQQARAGGVYLFRDRPSAESYLEGPLIQALRESAATTELRTEILPLVVDLCEVTAERALAAKN